MRGFLIVSHGDFAKGMKMSVEMVTGERDNVYAIGLTPEGGPSEMEEKIDSLIPTFDQYEDVFVFTDLYGGSPGNTVFVKLVADPKVSIISGVNFPMLLTAILTPDITVDALITEAKGGIIDLKAALSDDDDEEEDEV